MAIDFPNAPFLGQIYPLTPLAPGETTYLWDGEKWTNSGPGTGVLDFPSSPAFGQAYGKYIWDGEKWAWNVTTAPGGGDVIFAIVGNPMIIVLEDF